MRRFLLIVLALFIFSACSREDGKTKTSIPGFEPLKAGSPANDFYYKDMDEKPFRLSDHKGKVVLVYFWRMKCKECQESMVSLEALHKKYKDRGLVVVAVGADNMHSAPLSNVLQFIEKNGFTFVNIRDDNGLVAEAFNAMIAPEAYIIDKNGVIAAIIRTNTDWMNEENTRLIESLL